MSASLSRRLRRVETSGPQRVRVVVVPWNQSDDNEAIERAKTAQGVVTGPNDLLVIVRKFTEARA